MLPAAIAISNIQESRGVSRMSENEPMNHLIPSLESRERMLAEGYITLIIHEASTRTACMASKIMAIRGSKRLLFFIGNKVVGIKNMQFDSSCHKSGGINSHSSVAVGEEFAYQVILSLLKTLYSEGHTSQTCNLVFGISESQMA